MSDVTLADTAKLQATCRVDDFDFDLPDELIAQHPAANREDSRMLILPRESGMARPTIFRELPDFLKAGDCLVFNDSKVMPARLFGVKRGGSAKVEVLLVEDLANGCWKALLRPGKRLKPGSYVDLAGGHSLEVLGRADEGAFQVHFPEQDVYAILSAQGHIPLPPYISREDEADDEDRYQTIYAKQLGSVAAPTAGLHFGQDTMAKLDALGVNRAYVTLHVGPGTFKPVSADEIEDHVMHEEAYSVSNETACMIHDTRKNGGRIIAVGTTSVRVLESCADAAGNVQPGNGRTRIFMYPPYRPKVPDGLLTNFHLPRSTLLMLVSCFAERERVLSAYHLAVEERFRFYSYGDCMLLL